MITHSDIEKLLTISTPGPTVLSLYAQIPADPADWRDLPAKLEDLERQAVSGTPGATALRPEQRQRLRDVVERHQRDWPRHTAAIFACEEAGLAETYPLPCLLPEIGVFASSPHVRPMLASLDHCPAYYVVVVDEQHGWLFRVAGHQMQRAGEATPQTDPPHGYGGWYGLDSYRINHRIMELTRHHYRETAAMLSDAMTAEPAGPFVVGGHAEEVPSFLAELPAQLHEYHAGTFAVDPHTLTLATARDHAAPLVDSWLNARDADLVAQARQIEEIQRDHSDVRAVTGLRNCLAAVNAHAVSRLVVPVDGLIPGFSCVPGGELTADEADCPASTTRTVAVPDLLESMVVRTLHDGGEVRSVADPPGGVSAWQRFQPEQVPG